MSTVCTIQRRAPPPQGKERGVLTRIPSKKKGLPSRVPQFVSSNQRSSLLRLPLLRWRHVSNSRVFAAFVDTLVYFLLCVRPVVLQRWSLMPPKQQLSSHPQSMFMLVVTRSKTMLRPRIG